MWVVLLGFAVWGLMFDLFPALIVCRVRLLNLGFGCSFEGLFDVEIILGCCFELFVVGDLQLV